MAMKDRTERQGNLHKLSKQQAETAESMFLMMEAERESEPTAGEVAAKQ